MIKKKEQANASILKKLLLNEREELLLKYDLKLPLRLLVKLAGIKLDHIRRANLYSEELLEEDIKKVKKISFTSLLKFK